jgi:hypothetical protein
MLRLLQSGACVAFLVLAGCPQHRSLPYDAEVAEDLAIRYADAQRGPHSGHFESMAHYGQVRDQRIAEMFKTVASRHGVTEEQVRESLTHRPLGVDLVVILSFAVFYAWVADIIVRRRSMIMTAYISIVLSAVAVLFGESWAGFIESVRLGTGHLSYRADRIPWGHHRVMIWIAAALLCWLVAIVRNRRTLVLA